MKLARRPPFLPRGFSFAAAASGLKKSGLDVALISSDAPATAAAVFTTNRVRAAPVEISSAHLRRSGGRIGAIVVNSGNANCWTGARGLAAARATASAAARHLHCRSHEVLVCSTGVIGVPLRVERILAALPGMVRAKAATPSAFDAVTRAIMTTDTRPKWAAVEARIGGKTIRMLGCAKGAGMIHPQMATMLAFVLTDAAIAPAMLRSALRQVVRDTFNAITVDGDTSTNDTVAVLASGASGAAVIHKKGSDSRQFWGALRQICEMLALQIVGDGEGAKRVIEISVEGAQDDRAAERVARTIATSPLVKTAFAGADPNWGRILAAAGRSGVAFDPQRVSIWLAGRLVCQRGAAHRFNERALHRRLAARYVRAVVDLGMRRPERSGGRARIWTCDFTGDYVEINASYRS